MIGANDRYEIGRLENEKSVPDLLDIENLCKILGCSADYLIGTIEYPTHELTDISRETGMDDETIVQLCKDNDMDAHMGKEHTTSDTIGLLLKNTGIFSLISAYLDLEDPKTIDFWSKEPDPETGEYEVIAQSYNGHVPYFGGYPINTEMIKMSILSGIKGTLDRLANRIQKEDI